MPVPTPPHPSTLTPLQVMERLREGNTRFRANLGRSRDRLPQIAKQHWPVGTILSCMDSRTSAELIFDQGFGDIFSIRIGGNVVNADVLGSIEFATQLGGSKLIVVLGHSGCSAIKGACDHLQLGNLSTLLNGIQPAVYFERETHENRTSKNPVFVQRVADIQVRRSAATIIERSMVVRGLVERAEVGLVAAMYSVETGEVAFLDDTYMCGEIKHFHLDVPTQVPSPPRAYRVS